MENRQLILGIEFDQTIFTLTDYVKSQKVIKISAVTEKLELIISKEKLDIEVIEPLQTMKITVHDEVVRIWLKTFAKKQSIWKMETFLYHDYMK